MFLVQGDQFSGPCRFVPDRSRIRQTSCSKYTLFCPVRARGKLKISPVIIESTRSLLCRQEKDFPSPQGQVLQRTPSCVMIEASGFMKGRRSHERKGAVGWAVLAAALYAVSTPVSKLLLREVAPAMLAALLYLGAGIGMLGLGMARGRRGSMRRGRRLDRRDLPYTAGMVVLDIAAPLCLMAGLTRTTSANASLLNNFEIVSTALIALLIFKERIGPRLWLAIGLITGACMLLSFEDGSSLQFSSGSLFVLLACICWGLENNCTRMISQCDPLEIVVIKGFGSGIGSLGIALAMGQQIPAPRSLLAALLLGFVAYGLSIFFYVYAQRTLGAAKTSAYYAVSPFLGAALSLAVFRTPPAPLFWVSLAGMALGTYLASI